MYLYSMDWSSQKGGRGSTHHLVTLAAPSKSALGFLHDNTVTWNYLYQHTIIQLKSNLQKEDESTLLSKYYPT